MNIEDVYKWCILIVDIVLAIATITHTVLELKKQKKNVKRSKAFSPTIWMKVLTLLLVSGLILLLLLRSNSRVFSLFWENKGIIWKGVMCTLEVSLLSILFGTIIGAIVALLITIPKKSVFLSLIDSALYSFIYILLGIPALVLLFLFYYGPTKSFSVFWTSIIALSINLAPFVAKIIIASIKNITKSQIDSAISFGYTWWQRFLYFQVEFVVKNASQPLLVEYYTTIKLSSLAGIFSLYEIYHATADIVTNTYDTVNAYIIMAVCYVVIVSWLAVLADYLESKWKIEYDN